MNTIVGLVLCARPVLKLGHFLWQGAVVFGLAAGPLRDRPVDIAAQTPEKQVRGLGDLRPQVFGMSFPNLEPPEDELPERIPFDRGLEALRRLCRFAKERYLQAALASSTSRPASTLDALSEEELRAEQPWSVRGRVLDDAGQPIGGAECVARCGIAEYRVTGSTTSAADGSFRLRFGAGEWGPRTAVGQWQFVLVTARKSGFEERPLRAFDPLFIVNEPLQGNRVGLPEERMIVPDRPYRLDLIMAPVHEDTAAAATAWGPPQDGVQVRAWPTKKAWQVGETVVLRAEVQNTGTFDLHLPKSGEFCELDWDGQWYGWDVDGNRARTVRGGAYGQSVLVRKGTELLPLRPGETRRDLKVTLGSGWQTVTQAELEQAHGENGFFIEASAEHGDMSLSAGKHSVRIAYVLRPARVYGRDRLFAMNRKHAVIRPVSNPVEIEIAPSATQPAAGLATQSAGATRDSAGGPGR